MSAPDRTLTRALIFGCDGATLVDGERALFRATQPLGFILFARNCVDPTQLRRLVSDLRETLRCENAPVLIDQEGGRVARLGPPHWRKAPPARLFGTLAGCDLAAGREAALLNARLTGRELAALGITVDCTPVLDVPGVDGHDIIGDRAFAADPVVVADLGRAVCDGMLAEGVAPVIKHIPGHGRAGADSHKELPVVDAPLDALRATDFEPFRALADAPWAMTAHVLYRALDTDRCASVSPVVIERTIRGEIGFNGLLVSDDINMHALAGTLPERAQAVLAAGCDVALHCSGVLSEMAAVAAAVPSMTGAAMDRFTRAESIRQEKPGMRVTDAELSRRLDALLAQSPAGV